MAALGESYEVDQCLGKHWFRYMLNRNEIDADLGSLEASYRAAGAGPTSDFSIRGFIQAMVESTAFRFRSPGEGEPN
jgi:hypothetical protein